MRVHCIDPANPVNLLQNYVNFFLDAAPDEILAIAENYWRALGEGQWLIALSQVPC